MYASDQKDQAHEQKPWEKERNRKDIICHLLKSKNKIASIDSKSHKVHLGKRGEKLLKKICGTSF